MAVCGSVACAVRHCFQAAGLPGSVSVSGEGANSRVWGQMVADVLHRPLQIARKPEVGARGAAIAAMDAVGIAHDHDAWTRPEGVIEPRRDMAAQFDAGFEHYLKPLESARALWRSAVSR